MVFSDLVGLCLELFDFVPQRLELLLVLGYFLVSFLQLLLKGVMLVFQLRYLELPVVDLANPDCLEAFHIVLLLLEEQLHVFDFPCGAFHLFCCVSDSILHVFPSHFLGAHFSSPHLIQLVVL